MLARIPLATALSVNVNLVAQMRNRRPLDIPSVTRSAELALQAGAHGITIHPRPDARHIRAHDVTDLAALMQQWPDAEFNIEGNPLHNLMDLLRDLVSNGRAPQQCTFVPDDEAQATSDHGWKFPDSSAVLRPLVREAQAMGIRVSLFVDPDPAAMAPARATGADRVELYTEGYARAYGTAEQSQVLGLYTAAAVAAMEQGLGINAGHDLNQANLTAFLQAVPGVDEVSIGHALIADAVELGLGQAVREYLGCIRRAGRAR